MTSTSTTASWNDAATSAVATSGCLRTWFTTAVFRPLKEKSKVPSPSIGRGNRIASGSPSTEMRSIAGTARVAEAEVAGDLVEGLAGGVVDRGAEHLVAAVALHVHEQRVAARHEQHHERQLEVGLLEEGGVEVGLEVVHGDERHVPGERERLGRRHPDEERADQAGPVGGGDRVDRAGAVVGAAVGQAGLHERLGHARARAGRRGHGWRSRAPRRRSGRAGRPGC